MDPDGNIIGYFFIMLLFVGLSAFFVVSESAIISMNDNRLKRMADEGNKRAKTILRLVSEPALFLATIQTGTTIAGFLTVSFMVGKLAESAYKIIANSPLSLSSFHELVYTTSVIVATFLLLYILMVFGKLLPKRIGGYYNEKIALAVAPILNLFFIILKPFVLLFSGTTNLILRLLGYNPHEESEEVTEEEIRMLVDVGEEKGIIEQSEKDMINNIFEFDDRNVSEVMTHRMEVISLPKEATFDEIKSIIIEFGYSRIPVYDEDVDNIVGIIYAKDLLKFTGDEQSFNIKEYMRQPLFIPETARCTELFKEFKLRKVQLAVVVDEYGGTYGIVTMEDLLESIVGNIQDEYDDEEEDFYIISEGVYIFDGSIALDDVERALDIGLGEDADHDTIGAYIIDLLGDIPKLHEQKEVIVGDIRFTVLEVEDRRIVKLKAEILKEDEA